MTVHLMSDVQVVNLIEVAIDSTLAAVSELDDQPEAKVVIKAAVLLHMANVAAKVVAAEVPT